MKSFQTQTYYELLEVSVAATPQDIRSAYERLARLYAEDQVVLYGLIDASWAEALRRRLQEAAEVLLDDARRASYDSSIGLPPREAPLPRPVSPSSGAARPVAGWASAYTFVVTGPDQAAPRPSHVTFTVGSSGASVAALPRRAEAPSPGTRARPAGSEAGREAPAPAPSTPATAEAGRPACGADERSPDRPRPEQGGVVVPAAAEHPGGISITQPGLTDELVAERGLESGTTAPAAAMTETVPSASEPAVPVPASSSPVHAAGGTAPDERGPAAGPAEKVLSALPADSFEREAVPPPEPPVPGPVTPLTEDVAAAANHAEPKGPPPAAAAPTGTAPGTRSSGAGEPSSDTVAMVPGRPQAPREYRPPERPRPFEVPAGVEFNGDLLRQVRMARGLSLLQLSERTRIGMRHLENIEADRYDALPALVYLRGMLTSVASELGLDGLRVARSYLAFVDAHLAKAKG